MGNATRLGDQCRKTVDHQVECVCHGAQRVGGHFGLDRQIAFGGAAHDGEEVHDLVLHLIPVGFGLDQALETVDGVIERRTQLTKFVSGFYVRLLREIAAPRASATLIRSLTGAMMMVAKMTVMIDKARREPAPT